MFSSHKSVIYLDSQILHVSLPILICLRLALMTLKLRPGSGMIPIPNTDCETREFQSKIERSWRVKGAQNVLKCSGNLS